MYKILIADDDEIICAGLQRTVDWASIGGEVVATANDGEETLELIQRHLPDLAILDINMPFSDGLSVAQVVSQRYPKTKVIILSAYKEFTYAQKAFQYNVFNYLSKPCDQAELLLTAQKAFAEVEKERYTDTLQRNRLLAMVLHGEAEQITPANMKSLGFEQTDNSFLVAAFEPEVLDRSEWKPATEKDILAAYQLLEGIFRDYPRLHLVRRQVRVAVLCELTKPEEMQNVSGLMLRALKKLNEQTGCNYACGISKPCRTIFRVEEAYRQAQDALEYRNDFGKNHVIRIDEIAKESVAFLELFKECEDQILRAAIDANPQEIMSVVDQLFAKLNCVRGLACSTCSSLCVEMLTRIYRSTGDERLFEQFIKGDRENLRQILLANNFRDIRNGVQKSLNLLCQGVKERQGNDARVAVTQALQYIRAHYADPELNLQDVADAAHISSSYLQTLLKKYEHTSFSDYLNAVRMEAAMALLKRGNSKIYEVAFAVGLNSSQYFSRKFKKYFGIEPRQVRKSNDTNE